jgi:hypothetical protein
MKAALSTLFALALVVSIAHAAGNHSVHVQADRVGDSIELKGAGAFDTAGNFIALNGQFHVRKDIPAGPLGGLRDGDFGRWKATAILQSSGFKCAGPDPIKTVLGDDDTVVFQADFFRQGDGDRASFSAKVFISSQDEDLETPGIQNVWIQGVGCDQAEVDLH